MKNIFKSDFPIYLFIAFIIFFNFINSNILITHAKMSRFVDSDVLYLHRLFMDIFSTKHHLLSWNLTPAPYFFPDMLIVFILEVVTKNNIYAIVVLFAILQYLGVIFLAQNSASIILQNVQAKLLIYFVFLASLIFLVIPEKNPYYLSIEAVYHFGGFINGLLLIYFSLLGFYKRLSEKWVVFLLCIISLLGSVSDALFAIQFGIPALLLLLIIRPRLILSKYSFALILGMSFGLLLKYIFLVSIKINYLHFDPTQFFVQLKQLGIAVSLKFIKNHVWLGSLCLAFYMQIFFQLIVQHFIKKKGVFCLKPISALNMLRLYILLSVLTTLVLSAFFNVVFQRYMLNFYFFPLVFCWLPFSSILSSSVSKNAQVTLFLFAVIMAIYFSAKGSKSFRWEYYPPLTQCIDAQIRQYNARYNDDIQYGIANNSQAGAITAFSRDRLQVVEMFHDLTPHHWINNPERYRSYYDFAVIALPGDAILTAPENILDGKLIEKINGKPAMVFQCGQEAIIWIYGKNKLIVPS